MEEVDGKTRKTVRIMLINVFLLIGMARNALRNCTGSVGFKSLVELHADVSFEDMLLLVR